MRSNRRGWMCLYSTGEEVSTREPAAAARVLLGHERRLQEEEGTVVLSTWGHRQWNKKNKERDSAGAKAGLASPAQEKGASGLRRERAESKGKRAAQEQAAREQE